MPGTPEPSTELRRLQSPPSAQGGASLLQTRPQPAPGPSAQFSQAGTKPWQVWVRSRHAVWSVPASGPLNQARVSHDQEVPPHCGLWAERCSIMSVPAEPLASRDSRNPES